MPWTTLYQQVANSSGVTERLRKGCRTDIKPRERASLQMGQRMTESGKKKGRGLVLFGQVSSHITVKVQLSKNNC